MNFLEYKNDRRFSSAHNAFVITGKPKRADTDKKNRRLLTTNQTGDWILDEDRIHNGDLIFLVLPNQKKQHGYPRELHAGIVKKIKRYKISGRVRITVEQFYELAAIEDEVLKFFGVKIMPTGNTIGSLLAWNNSIYQYEAPSLNNTDKKIIDNINSDKTLSQTEKERIILARIGQGDFRKKVLKDWQFKCAITGCDIEQLLIASHINPWKLCKTHEDRLNSRNGLALLPNFDKLFDLGLISFSNSGKMLFSDLFPVENRSELTQNHNRLRLKPNPEMAQYLSQHRKLHGFI